MFTTAQANAGRCVSRWRYRYQAYAFFPLLLLEAINLRVASIRYLAGRDERHRSREALLFGAHMTGYRIIHSHPTWSAGARPPAATGTRGAHDRLGPAGFSHAPGVAAQVGKHLLDVPRDVGVASDLVEIADVGGPAVA